MRHHWVNLIIKHKLVFVFRFECTGQACTEFHSTHVVLGFDSNHLSLTRLLVNTKLKHVKHCLLHVMVCTCFVIYCKEAASNSTSTVMKRPAMQRPAASGEDHRQTQTNTPSVHAGDLLTGNKHWCLKWLWFLKFAC